MAKPPPETIAQPRLIVCEGSSDRAFLKALINRRELQAFNVISIDQLGDYGGLGALSRALQDIIALTNFRIVRDLVIVADADEDEASNFQTIVGYIESANAVAAVANRYSVPAALGVKQAAAQNQQVSTTVFLLPGQGGKGALDTTLLRALRKRFGAQVTCSDGLIACAGIATGAEKWTTAKIDKAALTAAIAVIHKKSPSIPVSLIFNLSDAAYLLPVVNESEFDWIAQRLSEV